MKVAVYPGSFDPITNGHIDILTRACRVFDKVIVLVAHNPNKQSNFSASDRVEMIKEAVADIPNVEEISGGLKCSVVTYGSDASSDYYATDITYDSFANASFTAHRKGHEDIQVSLKVPGEHNVFNALSAIALSYMYGCTKAIPKA